MAAKAVTARIQKQKAGKNENAQIAQSADSHESQGEPPCPG